MVKISNASRFTTTHYSFENLLQKILAAAVFYVYLTGNEIASNIYFSSL